MIAQTPNICNNIHLPAQSGSSRVLEVMRRLLPIHHIFLSRLNYIRGYSREAYLDLVARARQKIPSLTISSDFISGFCSETLEEHLETISLLQEVKYEQAFMV